MNVFVFDIREVLNDSPLSSLYERIKVKKISLAIIIAIRTPNEIKLSFPRNMGLLFFRKKKLSSAHDVNILSASGSRNCPHLVLNPYLRAYHPSYQSVKAAIVKTKKDKTTRTSLPDKKRYKNTGDNIIRKTLNVLGKFKYYSDYFLRR